MNRRCRGPTKRSAQALRCECDRLRVRHAPSPSRGHRLRGPIRGWRDVSENMAEGQPAPGRRAQGSRAFAVPRRPPRSRRATDALLLVISTVVLVVSATGIDRPPTGMESAVAELFSNLPSVLQPVWQMVFDLLQLWTIGLLVLAVYRRHWSLARDIGLTVALVAGVATIVGRLATDAWPDVIDGLGRADGPIDFPSVALAASAGAVAVAAPSLTLHLRHVSRWLVGGAAVGSLALELATPEHVAGALALGWAAASLIHLVFGSPAGVPSERDIDDALMAEGIDARIDSITMRRGVACARATSVDGTRFDVELRGRDSWDSQFVMKLWRFLWYETEGSRPWSTRRQQVEHQAFVTLLAEQRGAPVAPIVSASITPRGDALLVLRDVGTPVPDDPDDDVLAACWTSLDELGRAGIRHGTITPSALRVQAERVWFRDLHGASVESDTRRRTLDRAQLLITTAVLAGEDRAVTAAQAALEPGDLVDVIPYVQPAAIDPGLLKQAEANGLDVNDFRTVLATALDRDDEELQRLRRFSLTGVLTALLLVFVGVTLVGGLVDVGIDNIVSAVRAASLPILLLAFVVGQTPRLANALALYVIAPLRIPFGRLAHLQFAITFVNLAMPSTAARVAVNIRFFQRSGLDKTSAITVGALDSVSGFVAQVSLVLTMLLLGLGSLSFSPDPDAWRAEATGRWLIILATMLAVSAVAVLTIAKLRTAVLSTLRSTWSKIETVARPPRRLVKAYAANVLVELLFSLCSFIVLRAFDQSVGYADVVIVNVAVALFAGLVPVPGGMGVTEAALAAGYIAIGVDEATAISAALCYRLITFYTPPIFGARAFHSLQRQHFL